MDKDNETGRILKQYEPFVRAIGLEATRRLCEAFGGDTLYIPKPDGFDRLKREAEILQAYNGNNVRQLARRYRLAERTVYAIIDGRSPSQVPGQMSVLDFMSAVQRFR